MGEKHPASPTEVFADLKYRYDGSLEVGEPPIARDARHKPLDEICNSIKAPEGLTFEDLLNARR